MLLVMEQLSFFSAEAEGPKVGDLAGVLCAHGQIATFGRTAARLSVVVEHTWRARVLAAEFGARGVDAEVTDDTTSDQGQLLVRTAFRADLLELATAFNRGAVKSLPAGFRMDGGSLRLWTLACGVGNARGYLLPLDRRAPDTHRHLLTALGQIGLAGSLVGPRGGGPAVRVTGRRRLASFAELVGEPPQGAEAVWPQAGGKTRWAVDRVPC